jgi:beta-galactosidase
MSRPRETRPHARTVSVHPDGLSLQGVSSVLPLVSGSMHYFRHDPADWGPALDALRAMGMKLVDIYVPWGVHEISQGHYDFGAREARNDVRRFVKMAHERGLFVILRPGPHINAELSYFGVPERVVWDPACQARTPKGNPVILPMVPISFPVPSYASDTFHDQAAEWIGAVGRELSDLVYPQGPIVMIQVDNEGALYFRDGPYDQDYHPDATRLFRQFLRDKYTNLSDLREAWRETGELTSFASVMPPTRFDAKTADDLVRHMDWMEFHEHLLQRAMIRFADVSREAGFSAIPTSHNLPPGEAATALNPGRLAKVVDLVGLDYYHPATPAAHLGILRRTTELTTRAEGFGGPPFAAEMGAGYPPVFAPLEEEDSLYTLLAAMAYGLRGYNLYMAVDRDRWVGAPIDPHGIPRGFADDYRRINVLFDSVKLHELRRRVPVRLVVPRALRRLARATHAFGPVTPTLFNVVGVGFRESCLEEELGTGEVPTMAAEAFLHAFERALIARGVPFAYAGGDSLEESTRGASWIVCASVAGVKPELFDKLQDARKSGVSVTIGPRVPERDGAMRTMSSPHVIEGFDVCSLEDASQADALVAERVRTGGFPTYPVAPSSCFVTVHEDRLGVARVVFVMNPTDARVTATFPVSKVLGLRDLLGAEPTILPESGAFSVDVPARTVRVFAAE